jgi:hypothetical protein
MVEKAINLKNVSLFNNAVLQNALFQRIHKPTNLKFYVKNIINLSTKFVKIIYYKCKYIYF